MGNLFIIYLLVKFIYMACSTNQLTKIIIAKSFEGCTVKLIFFKCGCPYIFYLLVPHVIILFCFYPCSFYFRKYIQN